MNPSPHPCAAASADIVPVEAGERFARLTLALLGAVHLIVAASLVLVLLTLGSRPLAQETGETASEGCGGDNLIARLQRDDPKRFATMAAEAAEIPNGEGLLWRIERDGTPPSFLYGTMHVADPRVVELGEPARRAFDAATTVVIETDEIVDPAKAQAALFAKPELTMFTDGTTLETLLEPDDYALVEAELSELGVPIAAVQRMKPWMIASLVAVPACEMERKSNGAAFLDKAIAEEALVAGKRLEGLETVEEQLTAMASLPIELHVQGLIETLSLGPLLDDVMTTMTDLYLEGRTGMILPMIRDAAPPGSKMNAEGYADFEERIVLARNRLMAERARPILEAGHAFIAVGALHLPGEEGLIELLREDGYEVTRAE